MRKLCAVLFASATLVAATGPVAGAAGVADPATGTSGVRRCPVPRS
ncbi:MAG: hypothetical protein R2755_17740 [Acidimicrobiales bacterium]